MFGKKAVKFQNYLGSQLYYINNDKLVVIINSLKVSKIKKILLYEMKFLVPNYSCLHTPVVCPQLNLLNPPAPEQNSWLSHILKTQLRKT